MKRARKSSKKDLPVSILSQIQSPAFCVRYWIYVPRPSVPSASWSGKSLGPSMLNLERLLALTVSADVLLLLARGVVRVLLDLPVVEDFCRVALRP